MKSPISSDFKTGLKIGVSRLVRDPNPLITVLCALFLAALAYTTVAHSLINARDFGNTWRMARLHLWGRETMYSVARDGDMPFKYPPWTIPSILPFALFGSRGARILWAACQLTATLYVLLHLTARLEGRKTLIFVAALLWGLWQVNAMDGQFSVIFTAIFLWAGSPTVLDRLSWKSFNLVFFSSMKIFTGFPLLGLPWWKKPERRTGYGIAAIFAALCIPSMGLARIGPITLFRQFIVTAFSGGAHLGITGIRGKYNNGLPGLLTRIFEIPPEKTQYDLLFSALFIVGLAWAWKKLSKTMPFDPKWAGWIALIPVIHPLPYWYSFIMAFPLAAWAWDRAWIERKRSGVLFAISGISALALMTEKTMGPVGRSLELWSIKSWGILLLLWALASSYRRAPAR